MPVVGITDPEVNRALHDRWRTSLAVAATIMLLSAGGAFAVGFLYGDHSVVPVPMLLGGLAVLAAVRTVPRAVLPEERPAMARSAGWTVLGILLFFGAPLLLDALGWA